MTVDGVVLCADATPEGGQLAEALRARGYRVVESTAGGVVASASGRVVALLVLDVDDEHALAALTAFRGLPANAAVPIVLVGGPDAPVRDLTSAVEAGADAFLTRPLPIERAVRKVETYVGRPAARPQSRPADVWDVPPPDSVPAIPKAPRVPESVRASVREATAVTPRKSERVAPVREVTAVTPRRSAAVPTPAAEPATEPPEPREPGEEEPTPDHAPPASSPPPAISAHVSRTFVLPAQPSRSARAAGASATGSASSVSPAVGLAGPESVDAPAPIRERTLVLDPPARREDHAPPPAPPPSPPTTDSRAGSSSSSSREAPLPPPSLALAFDADEPVGPADSSRRVLLSGDLQNAIDAADRRLFGQAPALSPLSAPADENIDALVSPDMIDGLRQPLEVEERYEAHDAWTVLGEARATSSGGGRSAREATTGDLPPAPGSGSEPAPASTDSKSRPGSTPGTPRERSSPSAKSAPPHATPTDMSLRSDEVSLRARPRTGMLDARGLLPVLASCIRRRVDGRLTLRGMDGAVSLYLAGGKVVSARTDRRSRSLAWLLVRERRIDQTTARDLDREAESSGRGMGTVLLARGLVPGEDLDALERRYQEELVVEAIGESAGAGLFELAEGEVALPGGSVLSRSTIALTIAALRRRVDPADALARLGGPGARLRATVPIARLLEDAMLSPNEERAIRALAERSVGEVVDQIGSEVLAALHVLEQLGIVELEGNTARAVAAPPARPASDEAQQAEHAPPPERSPAPPVRLGAPAARLERRRREARPPDPVEPARALVQRAVALAADGDYFAVLGLARDASILEIRRAYVHRRRELGALDLPALGLASLADDRAVALEVLDEAFDVLRSDELRERYRAAISLDATPIVQ